MVAANEGSRGLPPERIAENLVVLGGRCSTTEHKQIFIAGYTHEPGGETFGPARELPGNLAVSTGTRACLRHIVPVDSHSFTASRAAGRGCLSEARAAPAAFGKVPGRGRNPKHGHTKPLRPLQGLSKRTALRSGLVHEYYQATENGLSPSQMPYSPETVMRFNAMRMPETDRLQRRCKFVSALGLKVIRQCRGGWKQR